MGEAPTNFVLKAYLTEDNARTDTTPLQVKTDTAYLSNGEQLQNFNFFTHTKYYFRIESNEPVTEFYIDWDDGEDNDPKGKANFTTIKLTSPQFVGITSHIFTRDKIHYPKIKVKSVSGFWSKYYQASGDHTFVGIDVLQAEASNQLAAGRNDRYKIEADTATPANSRIPAFAPTPKPPICILKADKKRVFSGINNALLGGKKGVKEGSDVRLTGGSNKIEEIRTTTEVKVTYTTTGLDTGNDTQWGARGDITTSIMTFGAAGSTVATISNVLEILKVELVNQLEDSVSAGGTSPATNKLYPGERMFLTLGSGKPSAVADTWANGYPSNIAEVSLGSPILEVNDPRFTVTLDATESYARTPEQTIDEYYIDDGKKHLNRGYTEGHYYQELGTVNKFTDIFKKSTLSGSIDTNKTNSGLMKRSYSFDIHHDWCDDNFRWLPKQVLARGQVKASTPAVAASPASDSKATYTYSFLEHWQNDSHATNYNTDGAAATYSWPDDMKSSNLLCMVGDRSGGRDDWKDLSLRNRAASSKSFNTANSVIFGIHGSTSQTSASSFDSEIPNDFLFGNAPTLDSVYNIGIVLAARDKKWTKQYFQRALDHSTSDDLTMPMAPRVNPAGTPHGEATSSATNFGGVGYDGYSYMNMRVQAFYTGLQGDGSSSAVGGAGAMWKPLKMLNKTKHPDYDDTTWYTSGVFEWEEPEDWVSIDPADIPDKYWPSGDFEGDASAFARDTDIITTAGVQEVTVLTVGTDNKSSLGGGWIVLNRGGTTDWDVFWWNGAGQSQPSAADVVNATGGPTAASQVDAFYEVDITSMSEADAEDYAEDLAAIINGVSHYGAVQGTSSNQHKVTVTNAATGATTDAPAHNNQYPNMSGAGHSVSVTTQGVTQVTGGNFFDGRWDNTYSKYAIMFVVEADGSPADDVSNSEYGCMAMLHTWPCSNNHSVLIDVIDPMCVSLSPYSISQSISFTHKGKYQTVTDRLGKADIRKIGAEGGAITFGGVDLSDAARKAFYDFQRKATPVYMDVTHTNGEYSRFFGTILSMSESHPQGGLFPKFGLQMQVSHMIQFDANGNMLTKGYISLGGDMDEPTFI